MKPRYFIFYCLLCAVAIGGCAVQPAAQDFETGKALLSLGDTEQGLAKIGQATKEAPENIKFRQFYYVQRTFAVNRLLAEAETARVKADFDAAKVGYHHILELDPGNVRAQAGLEGVQSDIRRAAQLDAVRELLHKGDIAGAQAKFNPILSEAPEQKEVKEIKKQIEQKSVQMSVNPVLGDAFKKKISLQFQDASLRSIFDVIARVSGMNFVFDKDINNTQKTTIFVKNTSIADAVKLLLTTNQLQESVLNENTVLIYPNTPAKSKDYQQLVVKSFYLANADVQKVLEMLKSILKVKDVFTDDKLNLLVIRDTPEVVNLAEKLVNADDLPKPEVVLEVEVLEMTTDRLTNLGLQYPTQLSASLGTAGSFTQTQLINRNSDFVTFQVSNPALVLNLQKVDTDTKLLANPHIRVKDREKAKIHIGQKLPVISSISTANVGTAESVSYIDVGLKLDVQPTIRLDDQVDMNVELEVSNVLQTIVTASGSQVYTLGTRTTSTTLRLRDGETQVLAGLIQNNESSTLGKLPGFGDIPLLGALFSNNNADKTKTELVLLITPRIVRNITRPDAQDNEFQAGTENSLGNVSPGQSTISAPMAPEPVPEAPAINAPPAVAPERPAPAPAPTPATFPKVTIPETRP